MTPRTVVVFCATSTLSNTDKGQVKHGKVCWASRIVPRALVQAPEESVALTIQRRVLELLSLGAATLHSPISDFLEPWWVVIPKTFARDGIEDDR
jgi:hypothetical protein